MTNSPRNFRGLKVRANAHQLTLACYTATMSFPKDELYGITSQIRRAASLVPANIAEGCGRGGNELIRFSRIALGSASELEYHLILSKDLGSIDQPNYEPLANQVVEVKRMLSSFIDKLTAES